MDERPNVTVIYQTPTPAGPGFGRVLLELLTFMALAGGITLIGGCALLWW